METKKALDSLYNCQIIDDESMASHPPMKTEPKHMPAPLELAAQALTDYINNKDVEMCAMAEAELAVRDAVNSHAALTSALDACVEALEVARHQLWTRRMRFSTKDHHAMDLTTTAVEQAKKARG